MLRLLKTIIGLVLFALFFLIAVAFLSANTELVPLDLLLFPAFEIKLGQVLLLAFVLGGLLGLGSASLLMFKQRRDRVRLEKRLKNSARLMSSLGS